MASKKEEKSDTKQVNKESNDKEQKKNLINHKEKKAKKETKEKSQVADDSENDSLENQLAEYKDKYLRLSAEFDNYRKRTLKEKIDLTKTASEEIIKKLLPVVDDFERGLVSMETAKDIKAVKDGVNLIYNKLTDLLKQQGVKSIDALENDFDMEIHEAVTKIPAPKEELKGKVVDVIEKGYYLHEKIIRFPKVVIGE